MKTKNNIQKTVLRVVALTGLIILGFTVNGQYELNSLFGTNETNNMAMALGKKNINYGTTLANIRNFADANSFSANLAEETEEPLQLEDWMMDETNFSMMNLIEAETESSLEIEDWMTKENNFDINTFYMVEEIEEPMKLEDWMMNETSFSMMNLIDAEIESPLEIEDWMTKDSNFDGYTFSLIQEIEETMDVETWMLNENNFKVSGNKNAVGEPKESKTIISTGKYIFSEITNESKLQIEGWMLNANVWK